MADEIGEGIFRVGARVKTSRGEGSVAYVRMDASDLTKVAAVSVVLDARRGECCYAGTLFVPGEVVLLGSVVAS